MTAAPTPGPNPARVEAEDPALNLPWSVKQDQEEAEYQARKNDPKPRTEGKTKAQPHSALKKRCRDALAKWSGARGVLIPIQNVKVTTGKGAAAKTFMTGRVGAADDIWLYREPGENGRTVTVGLEYKHGHDTQRETQVIFQRRWEAAGGVYLIVRSPEQMIAGIEAALRGRP